LINDATSHTISYESLQRVLTQLRSFPERRQWIVELGRGDCVQRSGDALRFISSPIIDQIDDASQTVWWKVSNVTSHDEMEGDQPASDRWPVASNTMIIWVGTPDSSLVFREVRLSDYERRSLGKNDDKNIQTRSVTFMPSWKTSRIKIRQFLRMQGVSVHKRDDTILLVDSHENLVAVQIHRDDGQRQWILHKDFCHYPGTLPGKSLVSVDSVSPISFPLRLTRQNK
jgi:hypothetical protein